MLREKNATLFPLTTECYKRPTSQVDLLRLPEVAKITITVESTGDTDLFEWMTNSFERKDGSIIFLKRDSEATLKELKFKEAYIVKYKEDFDAAGDNPLTETFTLSAKEIEMGTAKHTNEWV